MRMFQPDTGIEQDDANAIRALVRDNRIRALLEFGPGASTGIFLDAGVERITTCEHDPVAFRAARTHFRNESCVSVLHHVFAEEISIPKLDGRAFDAAYVNTPDGDRMNTVRCALRHAGLVFVQDATRPDRMAMLDRIASEGFGFYAMVSPGNIAAVYRMKRLPPIPD